MDGREFIETIGDLAVRDYVESRILPSVVIAQAVLESEWGKSELAANANNLFGMKTTLSGNTWESVWNGDTYKKITEEQDTAGRVTMIIAAFRKYPSWAASVKDHSLYLKQAKNGSTLRYAGLIGETDYSMAVQAIKDGEYATDVDYVEKVCRIIEDYGLAQYDRRVVKMKINKLLTEYNHNSGSIDRIKYIVIHYVGATGGAEANCKYYAEKHIGASAHYFVDFDGSVWQSVEDYNIAWHCGAKSYVHPECRNANSIGIEMCVRNSGNRSDTSRDWYFEDATVAAAIELTKMLMVKYGIDADHVIRHYDVTGKICPNPYVYNEGNHTWDEFKAALVEPEEVHYVVGWYHDNNGWWYADSEKTYLKECWKDINGHRYYFQGDGYAVKGWQLIDGKWYYFEPTEGDALECALYVTDADGVQAPGVF